MGPLASFGPGEPFSCDILPQSHYTMSMRGGSKTAAIVLALPVALAAFALTARAADLAVAGQLKQPQVHRATTTKKPHVPPWSVSRPPVPSQSPQITPGGTFQRPQSTFSTPAGSFDRPTSTFAHPAAPYTPLKPLQPPHRPKDPHHQRPHHRHKIIHPHSVFIQTPVIYEPYYIPMESAPVPQEGVVNAAEPAPVPATEATPPVVIDLPPGTIVRRPAPAPTTPAAPATEKPAGN